MPFIKISLSSICGVCAFLISSKICDGSTGLCLIASRYSRLSILLQSVQVNVSACALGVKPYSTETEDAFLTSLNHALDNIVVRHRQCIVHKEVALSQVFREDISHHDLFYTGRFDFVVFDKRTKNPLLAIELDGKEHHDDETVKARDRQKEEICRQHNFQLIRVENSYARRYAYIKTILTEYFSKI